MPIKIPKGFVRRKSSHNALEEVENPPEPSFRVFERPSGGSSSRSLDGANALKRASEGRPSHSVSEDPDNIFAGIEKPLPKNRGSGGTDNSASTGALYDSSSSARFSSSSTLPSSTDVPIHNESAYAHSRTFHDIPLPPVPGTQFSLRAAGRTFSFGTRSPKMSTPPPQGFSPAPGMRDRSMTASTASTATPPRLLDSDLNLGEVADDFGNMFEGFGKRKSALLGQQSSTNDANAAAVNDPPPVPSKGDRASHLAPIDTDRSKEVEPSPYSWDSRNSQDGLLGASGNRDDSVIPRKSMPQSNSMPLTESRKSLPQSNPTPLPTTSHRALDKPVPDHRLRRSTAYTGRGGSTLVDDADAKLIMESVSLNRTSQQTPAVMEDQDETSSLFDSKDADFTSNAHNWRPDSTPPAGKFGGAAEASQFDSSIAAHARLAAQYEEKESSTPQTRNKVMTPAQFERYRQQQELTRTKSDASRSENSDASSDYDDEDEAEKNREAARQRRKQEAHLSVYRQQMMKVIGEQVPGPSLRPNVDRASSSTPNLVSRVSTLGLPADKSGSGKSSDADEDDDVPLGILAAHGFPNKNRPPTRLTSASSIPNLRATFNTYPSSPGSVAGDAPGNRGSLPVFARNLPRDPYFGASLVNPSNREHLAMGGGASVHGGSSQTLPPGGLVGVIATEERARAMRRGSPNTQGAYDQPSGLPAVGPFPSGMPRPYTMMNMGSMGMPGPQQGLSPGEQAQIQMSQQMTQMMQMQMQWMQQMMQVQGMQGAPQPPMNSNFPSPMVANTNMRPMSMASTAPLNNTSNTLQVDQRTLSLLDPAMSSQWNNSRPASFFPGGTQLGTPQGQGYTSSIAPSERSNVGMAPRYRPVSTIQPDQKPNNRASTFTSSTLKPWNDENRKSSLSAVSPSRSNLEKATSMATVTVRPLSSGGRMPAPSRNTTASDEEDDEEGWTQMMKKREKKKSSWKMKKGTSGLSDLLHAVH